VSDAGELRVVVGEDSFLVREGIVRSLQQHPRLNVLAAVADLDALRDAIERFDPDVVVTDIRMPPTTTDEGIRLALELQYKRPNVAVVVLSQVANVGYASTLFEGGGARRAYLLKERVVDSKYLGDVIDSVVQGRPILDPEIFGLVIAEQNRPKTGLDELTTRELDVLELIAAGYSNAAIAKRLTVTQRAVERHVNAIFGKLHLANSNAVNRRVLAALVYARSQGGGNPAPVAG
jgi:DNA-binding NarL/FixJ family response regulator